MNPVLYGPEHTVYVIISVFAMILACVCAILFAKTEKIQTIVMRCMGGVLFVIIFTNRLALVFEHDAPNWMKLITDSVCSTSSYVLALALLIGKKDNAVLHFVWLICLAGGLITTFYPNFIGQHPSFLYPPTILGLMHHTFSAIVVMVMLIFKYVYLTYRKWRYMAVGFLCYLSYGAFLMCVLDYGNPFYMTGPAVSGTIFTIWVIAPIYVAVYAFILLMVDLFRRKKQKKDIT